ncbi:MAG TPA: hypothetical protein VMU28_00325 [Terriglobales bacterium]|nr:hypothetical protein [Terriglobales bacterium]
MIATGPLRFFRFLLIFALGSVFAAAQNTAAFSTPDWHLSPSGARAFFTRSVFAHGYMHGYEEGFYQGDLDLQFGHQFQPPKEQARFKKIRGYQSNFGDHKNFENGYRKGYAVGYIDAFSGHRFRAMQLVSHARTETQPRPDPQPDPRFDDVFRHAYEVGERVGLQDGRSTTASTTLDPHDCGQNRQAGESVYCEAYQAGYRLGYSDGFANQREGSPVIAKK